MGTIKVAFYDAKPYDQKSFNKVNERYGFDIHYFPTHLNEESVALAAGFDTVCVFVNDTVNAKVIDKLKENGTKLIALRSAGYNNIDLHHTYGKMHVVRVPAYSPHAVAEHAVALMLSLNRKTHKAYFRTRDNNFAINGLLGFDMHEKTAGIIGTGKIGKVAAQILRGFGMNVLAFDVYPDKQFASENQVEYTDLDDLYKRSDIISLHCPLTPENVYMINDDSIRKMKDNVMIINTGRGKLINTQDLIKGLKSKKIGSAGLDVYEEESEYFFEDFSGEAISDDVLARLLTFPNVLITSHQAFFTKEALESIAVTTLNNIRRYHQEHQLPNEICYQCNEGKCTRKESGRCF
ncbi:2-hydroxyacid dehydrogenase [Chitinispirillales bacterium ANBcel5]|uniref:2-hydroxyacid dehydrogenase n=1 Tax=Cellulosispirillum alkaliphilum TaxID=3039283 RepID=UPI002A54BBE0|nr:2-hydroxyacid dehydrogenase [Chitinispirillales bacterium ANBcel5]